MNKIRIITLFGLLIGLFNPGTSFAQTPPTISSVTDNRADYTNAQIPRYEKLEITFNVQTTSQNPQFPYDAAPPAGVTAGTGITVNAEFSPDNFVTVYTQPAYYQQNFTYETRNNRDWIYPDGTFAWKVRFAPTAIGTWQYRLRGQDASGTSVSNPQSFTVTSSTNKGFIRVSPSDPRYFQYEDGTYFPGLSLNFGANSSDVSANAANLQAMEDNGIQLGRMWLSSWSIFGSAWNPWHAMPNTYDGYLPRSSLEAYDGDFRLKLAYRASNPSDPSCTDNCSYWKASQFIGWLNPQPAVKTNTNYRVRVRYRAQNIIGPRNSAYQTYGLVAKSGGWLDGSSASQPAAHNSGSGTVITSYGGNTPNWSEISGTWNSGNNNYLPSFYLTLENVTDPGSGNPAATAFVDYVWIEEDLGNGQYGPNILNKPSMQHHLYFDQRMSHAFDRLVDLAKQHNVYLRPVILEKDEYIQNHIDFLGNLRTDDAPNLFYGNGRNMTAVRWYQQTWWRYLQARWGYSTAIHSWELINEGNPGLNNHFILTDEMGKYMRQFAPNNHMVSTSNWHSFPANLWAAQPNIDFADVHYYQPRSAAVELADPALATYNRSMEYGALISNVGKPVIRGETGFVETGSGPSIPEFQSDTVGLWLHKFIWGGINPGGMMESYWYTGGPDGHLFNARYNTNHRPKFKTFSDFIKDVPLNNGHYEPIAATADNPNIRAWGQKDTVNKNAHFWVQNIHERWITMQTYMSRYIASFGQVALGQTGTIAFTFTNPQSTTSTIQSISFQQTASEFAVNSTTCTTIATGQQCTINLRYSPINKSYTDTLRIQYSYTNTSGNTVSATEQVNTYGMRPDYQESGTVTIPGFSSNQTYQVQQWDTYTGTIMASPTLPTSITANAAGALILTVNNLTTDTAVKIINAQAPTLTPSPVPSIPASPTPTSPVPTPTPLPGDIDGSGQVGILDLGILLSVFGLSGTNTNFDARADLDHSYGIGILDLNMLLSNFGR